MPRHKTRKLHSKKRKTKRHTRRRHRRQKGGAVNVYGQKVEPVIAGPITEY
jgi:hypothetical protein